jgi:hypothetical protein
MSTGKGKGAKKAKNDQPPAVWKPLKNCSAMCPVDCGMAFVLVPHFDPGHASSLTEILQRATATPVV